MSTQSHYDNHLAHFYSWMAGDFNVKVGEFIDFLNKNKIQPGRSGRALDLGAGHGIHTRAMAEVGFKVTAVDFSVGLLRELKRNCLGMEVKAIEDDIRNIKRFESIRPQVIVCLGDTLTHLDSKEEAEEFIGDCADILDNGGVLGLSFRDYTQDVKAPVLIPVKSDESRQLTCKLEYEPSRVRVTDSFKEKTESGWKEISSTYFKTRLALAWVEMILDNVGLKLMTKETSQGMISLWCRK